MNKRVFLVGIAGGVLVSVVGWRPLGVFLPQTVLPNWFSWLPEQRVGLQEALGRAVGMAVLLLLTGLVAGLMSGARSRWGAMGAGAVAGWMAAWITEALLGGTAAGALGARNLLAHGLVPAQSQEQFIFLIAENMLSIVVLIYASVFISMLLGLLLGGLGGLLAGRRGQVAAPQPQFWLSLVTISLTTAALNLVVMNACYGVMQNITEDTIKSLPMPYPVSLIFVLPVGLSLLWLLLWQIVAWRTLREMPAGAEMNTIQSITFFVLGTIIAVPLLLQVAPGLYHLFFSASAIANKPALQLTTAFLLLLVILVLVIAHFLKQRVPGKVRVFFRRQGEARVIAIYFVALSLLTLLLIILAPPGGIWQHLWLLAGLVLGLGFAFLGLRAAWRSTPPEQKAPLAARDVFVRSFLSLLVSDLFTVLHLLPLQALINITIPAIAFLNPEDPLMPQSFQSVENFVHVYIIVTSYIATNLILFPPVLAAGAALLLWVFWSWLKRRSEAKIPMEQV